MRDYPRDEPRRERVGEKSPELDELLRDAPTGAAPVVRDPKPLTKAQRARNAALSATAALMIGGAGLSIGSVSQWGAYQWWNLPGQLDSTCTAAPTTPNLTATPQAADSSADLAGSAFFSVCGAETHASSSWWITTDTGSKDDTVWADFNTADSLTSWAGAAAGILLPDSTQYVGFLIYTGALNGSSGTARDTFYTACATPAITPSLTATPGDTFAILDGSAYVGCETHVTSDWWIEGPLPSAATDTVWADFASDSLVRWTGAGASAPLLVDSTYVAYVAYSGATLSSGVAVDTFTTTAALNPDMFKPADWNDTLYYYDFADSSNATVAGVPSLTVAGNFVNNWTQEAQGGRLTGYHGGLGKLLDSLAVGVQAQLATPPYVWENWRDSAQDAGTVDYYQSFSTDSAIYVRITYYISPTYGLHGSADKMWRVDSGSQHLLGTWDGETTALANSGTTSLGCYPYENTWNLYYPSDTTSTWESIVCRPRGAVTLELDKVQSWFLCLDGRPADGSEVASWGVVKDDQQGIAAYHADMNLNETFTDGYLDSSQTPWAGPLTAGSMYIDDLLIMSGASGSGTCTAP